MKAQLLAIEESKQRMVQQYELELKGLSVERRGTETDCTSTQTDTIHQSDAESLRTLLTQVSQHCLQLDSTLEKSQRGDDLNITEREKKVDNMNLFTLDKTLFMKFSKSSFISPFLVPCHIYF